MINNLKINNGELCDRDFSFKDHLGSIRAVINQNNVMVEAQDYDPWGHLASSWDTTTSTYKFTGKERDNESNYDYFGARYYDARIGRWGAIDPLFEKHIQFNPYNYVLGNPMVLIDPDGKQLYITGKDAQKIFDEWDKYYLDFDNKSGRVGIKKNASKKDLNKVDLQIWNFVQNHSVKNKNAIMKILSLEQPFYNGKLFLGDGYGGNSFENDEYIGEQYLYLPHLMKMEKYSIMNKTVSHAIYEAIVGIIDGLNYDAAHEIAKNDVSEVNRLWFEAFKMQDGAIIKEGFQDKRNNTEYIFYIYDKDKGVFNEK